MKNPQTTNKTAIATEPELTNGFMPFGEVFPDMIIPYKTFIDSVVGFEQMGIKSPVVTIIGLCENRKFFRVELKPGSPAAKHPPQVAVHVVTHSNPEVMRRLRKEQAIANDRLDKHAATSRGE